MTRTEGEDRIGSVGTRMDLGSRVARALGPRAVPSGLAGVAVMDVCDDARGGPGALFVAVAGPL